MYMTRIWLKRQPAANTVHSILSSAFPGKRCKTTNASIWRIDRISDSLALIIVSTNPPDLLYLIDTVGSKVPKPLAINDGTQVGKTVEYDRFLSQVENNQSWHFRLCANPVEHKKLSPADRRGKVFALQSVEKQLAWLDRQGSKYGFAASSSSVIDDSWIMFDKTRIRSVTFDGILTVTDADSLRLALSQGIGRGKAYGCGLLTIAKVLT